MKVLTANRLTDGEAVWLTSAHLWAETIDRAEIASDAAAEERLERAGKAAIKRNEVIDVNLIDIAVIDGAIKPQRLREQIRANGPTTHTQFGKQARVAAAGQG